MFALMKKENQTRFIVHLWNFIHMMIFIVVGQRGEKNDSVHRNDFHVCMGYRSFTCQLEAPPKPVGTVHITEEIVVFVYGKMPNRFHRWMAKLLLGWKYEDMEDDE